MKEEEEGRRDGQGWLGKLDAKIPGVGPGVCAVVPPPRTASDH